MRARDAAQLVGERTLTVATARDVLDNGVREADVEFLRRETAGPVRRRVTVRTAGNAAEKRPRSCDRRR
jgi:hypothetical protein